MWQFRMPFSWFSFFTLLFFVNIYSAAPDQDNLPILIKKISPSVVVIQTYKDGNALALGSGFFIDKNIIITNYHVLKGASSAEIKTANGKSYPVKEIIAEDKDCDILMFKVDIPAIEVRILPISKTIPEVGERIIVIGNPEGLETSVSEGIVSAVREVSPYGKIIQTTAPISPGSSGGPALNLNGQVIGIISFQMINGQNLNFAISNEVLRRFIKNDTLNNNLSQLKDTIRSPKELFKSGTKLFGEECDQAISYYLQSKVPDNAEAYFTLGNCFFDKKQYKDAIAVEKIAINKKPDYVAAYDNLGYSYLADGQWSEAATTYNQEINILPAYIKKYKDTDSSYFGNRMYNYFAYTAYCDLGIAYNKLRQFQDAITSLNNANRFGDDAELHYNLGLAYLGLGQKDKCVQLFRKALTLNPNLDTVYILLGEFFSDDKNYSDAIQEYKQAIKINPDNSIAHAHLADAYSDLFLWKDAINSYRMAIKLNPSDPDIYFDFSIALNQLFNKNKYIQAVKDHFQIESNSDDNANNNDLLIESISALKQAIKLKPDFVNAHYNLGLLYLTVNKDKAAAVEEYKTLKDLDKKAADSLFNEIYK